MCPSPLYHPYVQDHAKMVITYSIASSLSKSIGHFGGEPWPDLSVCRVMLLAAWTWGYAAEVKQMSGLSGLGSKQLGSNHLYSKLIHTQKNRSAHGKNRWNDNVCVVLRLDGVHCRRSVSWSHLLFAQLNGPASLWSAAAAAAALHPLHEPPVNRGAQISFS